MCGCPPVCLTLPRAVLLMHGICVSAVSMQLEAASWALHAAAGALRHRVDLCMNAAVQHPHMAPFMMGSGCVVCLLVSLQAVWLFEAVSAARHKYFVDPRREARGWRVTPVIAAEQQVSRAWCNSTWLPAAGAFSVQMFVSSIPACWRLCGRWQLPSRVAVWMSFGGK